jgi:hypothetical protein
MEPGETPSVGDESSGEDYLKTLPKSRADRLRAINEGRIAPPTETAAQRSPRAAAELEQLFRAFPGADLTVWKSRNETRAAFSKGIEARATASLNTLAGHFHDFMETAEKLSQRNVKSWNRIDNAVKDQLGQPAYADYVIARNAVTDELARVFQGAGAAAENEKQRWLEALDASRSPAQFRAVLGRLTSLVRSRMDALESQHDLGMNYNPDHPESRVTKGFMNPKAKEKFEDVKKWSISLRPVGPKSGNMPTPPEGVPPGSAYNSARKMWRSPDGKTMFDESGKVVGP